MNDLFGYLKESFIYKQRGLIIMSKMEKLAREIAELLEKHWCEIDVSIYFEKKCLRFNGTNGTKWSLEDDQDVSKTCDYYNLDTITMTFEGNFYSVLNSGKESPALKEFNKLITSNGYYYELGNAWNLALYK